MELSMSKPELTAKTEIVSSGIPTTLQKNGVVGAGGAGFPSYAKWTDIDEIKYLLVNHQESEPMFYQDKWLARKHVDQYAALFDALLDTVFDVIVVAPKKRDRDTWAKPLETATGASVYTPEELPIEVRQESGVVFTYTGDRFQFGMERVLLQKTTGTTIRDDLPGEHGWIVHNTETMFNIARALFEDEPVTHKFVHVDGNVEQHRFFKVPVGTSASTLLNAAGRTSGHVADSETLVDGGPGWGFEIKSPGDFGVRKRTNGLLVLQKETVAENTIGEGRINVLDETDWKAPKHETEPTPLQPNFVRIPLLTNEAYQGLVERSVPVVEPGDSVASGDVIAEPAPDGLSNTQHASIDGTVTSVTDTAVRIERL